MPRITDFSQASNVGASIKAKQYQLYDMCYEYLIANFPYFSDANKLKVALTLANRMAPQQVEGSHTVTKMETVKLEDNSQELRIGYRIADHSECAN